MNMLEAKPLDENAESWKRENRLLTLTVLAAKSNRYAHTQKSSISLNCLGCSNFCFLFETGIDNRHKAVTIGFFFTDIFRILTPQIRWQG